MKSVCKYLAMCVMCVMCIYVGSASAGAQSSANFSMRADVVNAGGENIASGNFRLGSSVGDTVASGNVGSRGFVIASGFRNQNFFAVPSMLNLISVFSRKIHGAAGAFDLPIDISQAITGSVTVEPRVIGSGHSIFFRFDAAIATAGTLSVVDGANALVSASAAHAGTDVVVSIPALADNRRVTVSLTGVAGASGLLNPPPVSIGFLLGDINSSRAVNAADLSAIKANLGKVLDRGTFMYDLNADGTITPSDLTIAKSRSGLAIPP